MSSTKVPRYQSRRSSEESSSSVPLTTAEEIIQDTAATLVDPKTDSENYKAVFLHVIRNSGIPDLAWLMEFDPPCVDPEWEWRSRLVDNKISSFLLPEEGWQLIADSLSRVAGKKLVAGIESIKKLDLASYDIREKCTSVLQGVIDNFWMLDLIARREPVNDQFSVVDMEWRREFSFLRFKLLTTQNWLSEEETIELWTFCCYLETQACPRVSGSRSWASLPYALAHIPEKVRETQEAISRHELEGAL